MLVPPNSHQYQYGGHTNLCDWSNTSAIQERSLKVCVLTEL
jgi:hypothetical protein